jgi:hypothetical protein
VVVKERSPLKSRSLPTMFSLFWGEAVAIIVYLLNRAPTKALNGITQYEAWHGRKPDVHHLHTFRCVAYIKSSKPHLRNLDDRGTPVAFISYEQGTKAWHFFDPAS